MIYNHKLINDLAWSIGSPCLTDSISDHITDKNADKPHSKDKRLITSDWCNLQTKHFQTLLIEQDKNPQLIQSYLSSMPVFKLGFYFEHLIAYWFSIHPDFEILQRNLVIEEDKHTLGELDFLLRDIKRNKTIHLEVAVKFFLGLNDDQSDDLNHKANQNTGSSIHWFGPNLNDRLDIKLDKLFNKQIRLSENEITKRILKEMGLTIDEHWVLLKGRLFKEDNTLNKQQCWLTLSDFANYKDQASSQWIILPKTYWLAELSHIDYNFLPNKIHQKDEIIEIINKAPFTKPVCLAKINEEKETNRIFITPENWKEKAIEKLP